MFAQNLATQNIPVLRVHDEVQRALDLMSDFHVQHLPIVNDEQHYIGLISEKTLLDLENPYDTIESYKLVYPRPFVTETQHVYDVLRVFYEEKLSLLPVINSQGEWLGSIDTPCLLNYFVSVSNTTQPGGILVFEMNLQDYSLAEIAHIVESEDAIILNSYVSTTPADANLLEVTLKLNRQDLKHIIATFERFNYTLKAVFQESSYVESLANRYNLLMNYLNL